MKKIISILAASLLVANTAYSNPVTCHGKFINPITDICWSCMFPIFIAPIPAIFNAADQKGGTIVDADTDRTPDKIILPGIPLVTPGKLPLGMCTCPERIIAPIGLMMSWYEPSRFVDVTRSPFCMVGLGGIDMSAGLGTLLPAPGFGEQKTGGQVASSFYQAHWFLDPVMAILGIMDTGCNLGASKSMDLMFMSEVDPTWNDDSLSIIFSPEVILFTSLPAQLACGVDCIASSLPNLDATVEPLNLFVPYYAKVNSPTNTASSMNPSKYLFWCAGCQGSFYPLDGNNAASEQALQTTVLTSLKLNGLVHRMGIEDMTTGTFGMCNNILPDLMLSKQEWKYSMAYPIPQTAYSPKCCNSFGETDTTWNTGASFPYTGEDFSYVQYHQRDCCFL